LDVLYAAGAITALYVLASMKHLLNRRYLDTIFLKKGIVIMVIDHLVTHLNNDLMWWSLICRNCELRSLIYQRLFKFEKNNVYQGYLEIRRHKTIQFLKENDAYDKEKISYIIDCLKRRSGKTEMPMLATAAIISFLGFFLYDIYKRYIEMSIVERQSSEIVFFKALEISLVILGVWFAIKPIFLTIYEAFLSSREMEAEKALNVIENIYLDFI